MSKSVSYGEFGDCSRSIYEEAARKKHFDNMMKEIESDGEEEVISHPKTKTSMVKSDKITVNKARRSYNSDYSDSDDDSDSNHGDRKAEAKHTSEIDGEFQKMAKNDFGIQNISEYHEIDLSAMRNYIYLPVAKGERAVKCYLIRNRSGGNMLTPHYSLFLEDGKQFLLSAKKRIKNRTSNYLISLDKNPSDRRSAMIVGKLRANWSGSRYSIYDHGLNPDKTAIDSSVRKVLGEISFSYDKMGPGKMGAAIPRVLEGKFPITFTDTKEKDDSKESFSQLMEKKSTDKLMYLRNNRPKYDHDAGGHVLNFHGRVTMSSVKNFQMICDDSDEDSVLQFGRVSCQPPGPSEQCSCHKNTFNMDFSYPLSPLQAFAICLATLDGKLADNKNFENFFPKKEAKK